MPRECQKHRGTLVLVPNTLYFSKNSLRISWLRHNALSGQLRLIFGASSHVYYSIICLQYSEASVLRDHCCDGPHVFKDNLLLAKGSTFQHN